MNVGFRSTPNYDALAAAAVRPLPNGTQVFAGQRDDPFFVDLNVFDLLAVPPADTNNSDALAGFNVHTIAIEVPIATLTANGTRPSSATDPNAVIGVWSTASRPVGDQPRRRPGAHSANYVQVSRLGQPLVNEVVIPRGTKDIFNSLEPTGDAAALPFVTDPEVPKLLLGALRHSVAAGAAQRSRHDLPDRHSRPEPARRRTCRRRCCASTWRFRRRPTRIRSACSAATSPASRTAAVSIDDVVDIALRAVAGATPLTPNFNTGINAQLGDGVAGNDKPFLTDVPVRGDAARRQQVSAARPRPSPRRRCDMTRLMNGALVLALLAVPAVAAAQAPMPAAPTTEAPRGFVAPLIGVTV